MSWASLSGWGRSLHWVKRDHSRSSYWRCSALAMAVERSAKKGESSDASESKRLFSSAIRFLSSRSYSSSCSCFKRSSSSCLRRSALFRNTKREEGGTSLLSTFVATSNASLGGWVDRHTFLQALSLRFVALALLLFSLLFRILPFSRPSLLSARARHRCKCALVSSSPAHQAPGKPPTAKQLLTSCALKAGASRMCTHLLQ